MRNNLLKMLLISLLMGGFINAKAQEYPRRGWPEKFVKATYETKGITSWDKLGDITLEYYPSNPNRVGAYIERLNNSGITDTFIHRYVYSDSITTIPRSMSKFKLVKGTHSLEKIFRFTYDSTNPGKKIETVEQRKPNYANYEKVLDSFDATGRLIYSEVQRITSVWYKLAEIHYFYGASGKMDSIITKLENGDGEFVPSERSIFKYDGTGNLIEEKIDFNADSEWEDDRRFTFAYTNGIEEVVHKNNLHVFPNPCQDIIKIELPADSRNITTELYNMIGQKVLNIGQGADMSKGIIEINLAGLPAGSYILRCNNNNHVYTQMINKN